MSIHETAKRIQGQLERVLEVNRKLQQLLDDIHKHKHKHPVVTKSKIKTQ